MKVTQSCPTFCDSMDHGNLQARILEWVAFPFSRDLPNPGIEPRLAALQVDSLPIHISSLTFKKFTQIILLLTVKWRPVPFHLDFSRSNTNNNTLQSWYAIMSNMRFFFCFWRDWRFFCACLSFAFLLWRDTMPFAFYSKLALKDSSRRRGWGQDGATGHAAEEL